MKQIYKQLGPIFYGFTREAGWFLSYCPDQTRAWFSTRQGWYIR